MPILADYARKERIRFFLPHIPKDARVLEIGCADGWVGRALKDAGYGGYVGLDLKPAADIVGDIREWKCLGIDPESYDIVIAFEVVEHVDCIKACYDILRRGGMLMVTSPVPHFDWLCRLLEGLRLNQRRTSPHDHLIYFEDIPWFECVMLTRVGYIVQFGIFRKP
jgi:2-polyprenyl-3-methyl-5-hydroxy-6-metoxy-1,4-benzoquinol methylase